MNFPVDIPKRINPQMADPVSKSVIYTPQPEDYTKDTDGNILVRFPYSKDTYWTNFRYTCYGPTQESLTLGIILITSEGYTYKVSGPQIREQRKWYDTTWPIPSVYTNGETTGVYLWITPPADANKYVITVSLLGFMDLFPKVENYLLLSPLDTYQFAFCKYELDDLPDARGAIYDVNTYGYIQEINIKTCGNRLINIY